MISTCGSQFFAVASRTVKYGGETLSSASYLSASISSRDYGVAVDVTNNNVQAALALLRRRCAEADLPKETRKRAHHLNPSERRFGKNVESYNKVVGIVISQRVHWLSKRSPVPSK